MRVGWTRKHKKDYWIYHFYFYLGPFNWWSVHYKVRGNKKIRPEKLICKDPKKENISHYPYNLKEELMDGWVEVKEDRWNTVKEKLNRRDKFWRHKLGELGTLIKNARQEV